MTDEELIAATECLEHVGAASALLQGGDVGKVCALEEGMRAAISAVEVARAATVRWCAVSRCVKPLACCEKIRIA